MFGLVEFWLFSRLGINFNLKNVEENNIFQNGCVLVNILQKYGLVNNSFSRNIHPTSKKVECIKNLKLLKPLFDMLKIKYNDNIINDIVENKAGTIINLLYELYICLENKQHLYFITQQNLEKVSQDIVKHLDSVTVNENIEESEDNLTRDMCLEQPLISNADVIKWYKTKYEKVKSNLDAKVNKLKKNKELMNIKPMCLKPSLSKLKSEDSSDSIEDLPHINSFLKSDKDENLLNYEEFIARYKSKQQARTVKKCFEHAIQHELLQRTWSKIEENQNKIYNTVFSQVLLKQSQYEKQILSKLIQAQKQTHIQNENRIWAKQSIICEHENKIMSDFELKRTFEMLERMQKNEQHRTLELHKRLYKEKKEIVIKENYKLCEDIVDSLLELAICTAEYKSRHGVEVSKGLWDNWMKLFFKSQPIRVQLQSLDDILAGEDLDYDEAISFEKEQDEILNENDVDEYLLTSGRWFFRTICLEYADLYEKNLAFIVYRLLSMKYPLPPSPPAADLPPFKIAGILCNFHDTDLTEKLKLLLTKPAIHIFDTETAVKKCISQFQIETSPSPQEKIKGKKEDSKSRVTKSSKQPGEKEKKKSKEKEGKKSPRKKSKKDEKLDQILNSTVEDKIISIVDKETQTSIAIEMEEEKNKRTCLGILGEEVSNTVKQGEKLEDSLLVSVIIEYLKSLKDFDGWLLLNYPLTIDQAFNLELALTGKKLPMEDYVPGDNEELKDEEFDEFVEKRKSRLLNCPLSEKDTQSFKSYFSVFVKIEKKDHEIGTTENNILDKNDDGSSARSQEVIEKVSTTPDFLKELYNSQGIFKEFYNELSDLNSLKALARVILNEDGIEATPSIDLFGEETLKKITKGKKTDKKGKSSLANKTPKSKGGVKNKGKINDKVNYTNEESVIKVTTDEQESKSEKPDNMGNLNETPTQMEEKNDLNWNFITLPLNNEFGVLLATIWENIESCYINNLKDILFESRLINLRLHPYCIYVEKEMKKVIDKNDLKQNLVNFFQEYYNNISNELRTLPEMKTQLYCRLLELQQNLWDIADERKKEIEAKRQDIINENWLVSEICLLINNYLSLIQTELERSIETLKLVNDYYMNMLERNPPTLTIRSENQNVDRISVEMLLNVVHKMSVELELAEKSDENNAQKTNLIAHCLISCSDEQNIIELFYSIISKKIGDIKSNFNSISHIFHNQNKAEADFISNSKKQGTKAKQAPNKESKLKTSVKTPHNGEDVQDEFSLKETLIEEWKSTINTETERFNFRVDLIHRRANENIIEFYCFLESVFCNLYKNILSRYDSEISNINLISDYLRTSIEEESPLQHPLILGQETFFVGITDTVEKTEDTVLRELREDIHDCIFTINQLRYLMEIFKISGPLGVIRKQPLCYILQDLMLLDTHDDYPYLPKLWCSLSELELRFVIDDIFGLEFGVDWRDFIIYNLDIPYPQVNDILHLRKLFLSFDLEETELISLEDYEKVTLWFENELPNSPKQGLRFALVKKLLPEMFKVDIEHINYTALLLYFCKDFDPAKGLKKALSLSLGKTVVTSKSEVDMILQNEEEINDTVCSILQDIVNGIVMARETTQVYEIIESLSKMEPSLNGSTEVSWKSSLNDSLNSGSFKSLEACLEPATPPNSPLPKLKISFPDIPDNEKSWVTRIPVSTVLSVLNASFFNQDRRYALKNQYLNCLEDEADADGMIEAYNLVNLSCIQQLFTLTNKFKISIPCNILNECLNNGYKTTDGSERTRSTILQSW